MKLVVLTVSIFVFHCSARPLSSVDDPLQRIQQEVEQLKRSNEERITAQNDKLRIQDEKIASLEQSVEVPVAFSTSLTEDTIINDSPVIFDVVNLNIGDGFDEFTGVFRPPVDGVYQLTVYGHSPGDNLGDIFIMRNDDILCNGWVEADVGSTVACIAVAELTTGDSVQVTGDSNQPATLRGDSYSGFDGFLIYDS